MILQEFINFAVQYRYPCGKYITQGPLTAYVRHAKRIINRKMMDTFDIAKVDVEEEHQRKGHFKQFVLDIANASPWPYLYVECVHNEDLARYLDRDGWQKFPSDEKCYFKSRDEILHRV